MATEGTSQATSSLAIMWEVVRIREDWQQEVNMRLENRF
jgi:hypothetical protein